MWMIRRFGLFAITNLAVIATIAFLIRITGLASYLEKSGISYGGLLLFCTIWGMGGAFISLFISKFTAKMSMGVEIIDPRTAAGWQRDLVARVKRLADAAGLPMPEVGYYQSPEVNAFATGPSRSSALVAVSTGLLNGMDSGEIDGVLGHELSHVANGDMVTMTLVQGVVNSFVFFFAWIVSTLIASQLSRSDDDRGGGGFFMRFMIQQVLVMVFGLLGSIVVAYVSRAREYRADAGGAKLAGRSNMIAALERLKAAFTVDPVDQRGESIATLKISNRAGGFASLFATHPPLEERIAALRAKAY
ncbi:putative heat shock protein HtpX [Leptospira broomii serovar Hurstbridge str. 5399]|uniref:Protease HtpX homolog n=1 Tax=Leptospira broomii serovar Hurstbridge str. 5399 TaxID=1049789 RepID=T0GHJ7_9LEPT|nr:protease HtpX [Leptospira broomii]EQA46324.1 putative heat shock protein HtpX [Leptospira broomii serovar Hurstbridge str. 5399]